MPNSSADVPLATTCIAVLHALNLAVFTIQMSLSLLNIGILCRTSLLHRNLKFVLLAQSVLFTVLAIGRTTQIVIIFVSDGTPNYQIGYKIVLFLVDFPVICITYIGHVLFIERSIAIILSKNYEQAKSPIFSCVWFIILNACSIIIAAKQSFQDQHQVKITAGILIANYLALGISFVEIIAFSVMSALNLKMFNSKLQEQNLNERYQLAENIRTGRQLGPTFLLHFMNICVILVPSVLGFHQFVTDQNLLELLWVAYFLFLSISNALIEYTTISRHPILRRNALHILSNFFSAFSMPIPFVQRVGDRTPQNIGRIDGKTIQENRMSEIDNYFKILTRQW